MLNLRLKKKYLLIAVLSLFLLFTVTNVTIAADLENYESELKNIQKEQKANMRKLSGVERQISEYSYDIVTLDIQMNDNTKKILELEEKIDEASKKIEEYENSLNDTSSIYDATREKYNAQLRYIYENGMPNIVEILINSEGFSDFVRKMNVYTSILDYYKSATSTIKNKKEYINYVKKELESQKLQVETYKSSMEATTQKLNETIEEKKKKVEELQTTKVDLQDAVDALTKKKEEAFNELEDQINKIVKNAMSKANTSDSTTFTGGNFVWPVEGYTTITTRFNEVYNLVNPAGSAHTGCDISGYQIFGKPVVAIEAGTVIVATYSNYGYGNYIIIDHGKCTEDGKTYLSLYGHNTTLAVQKGDVVEKGQVISYVGSTGNSTGPHLHFEIRIDGKLSDPLVQYPAMQFSFPFG